MRTVVTILLLLFLCSNLWAVKVALIGDSDAVDQLTMALSRNQDIELMERAAIDKILKENKLTLNGGAELSQKFSHVDVIGVATLASVEFFNAQNGFKLARLPFKDALSSIRIQQVIEKSVVPEVHFLSIGFVNTTDIPVKVRPQVARILIELENTLVNMDKIQLLERDHLAAILQERELSQTQYSLTPSSKIIRCEFNQGTDADKIDLEICVSDSKKKILFHKKYMAINDGVFIAGEVGAALDSVSISDAGNDRKSEAKRYFEEYYSAIKRSGHRYTSVVSRTHEPLRKYVNAMYVLEPENPRYCYEKIFYELCFAASSRRTWREKIEILQKFVRDAKEFRQKFPDFRFPGSGNAGCGFRYHPLITIQPLNNLYNYNGKAPNDIEAMELSRLNDELHEIHRAVFIQFSPYYLDESSKIETWKDLQNYRGSLPENTSGLMRIRKISGKLVERICLPSHNSPLC